MHYVRKTPNGICSFYVIKVKNIIRIFGILITATNKILFFHQRKGGNYQSVFVIKKGAVKLAICQ